MSSYGYTANTVPRFSVALIDVVLHAFCLVDEVEQGQPHVDAGPVAFHQHVVLSLRIVQAEEEFCLAGTVLEHATQLTDNLFVQQFRRHGDGDVVDGFLLDGLQEFNFLNTELLLVAVSPSLLQLAADAE